MKILNIPFGDTIMTNTHKTRIHSLLAIIGLLAAIVFVQQTSMAQLVDSPESALHGRNQIVAKAIMSELGFLPPLKVYSRGIAYGRLSDGVGRQNPYDYPDYNQVTNLAQLSGITSLHIHGVMAHLYPSEPVSWTSVPNRDWRTTYFDSFSSSDFIGLTNLHTLNLSSVRLNAPGYSVRKSNRLPASPFDPGEFENLPNLRKLIMDRDTLGSVARMNELFSYKPFLDVWALSNSDPGGVPYRYHNFVRGDVDSPGSFFHGRPKLVTRQIFSALANANTNITSYIQVTDVAQLRDIEEMTLLFNIDADYGFYGPDELNSLVSAEVFDNLVDLRTLNLHVNRLTNLPAGIFDNLANLQTLNLQAIESSPYYNNRLTSLPSGIFDNLVNLQSLDLSGTILTNLSSGIFDNLVNLQSLDLSGTSLTSLPSGIFDNLVNLQSLDLSGTSLTSLPSGIFDNLVNLQSLDLSGTSLTSLPSGIFDNLVNLDPAVRAPIIQVGPAAMRSSLNNRRAGHEITPNGFKINEGASVYYSHYHHVINIPYNLRDGRWNGYSTLVKAAVFDISINPYLPLPIPELRYYTQAGTAKAAERIERVGFNGVMNEYWENGDYSPLSGNIPATQTGVVRNDGRMVTYKIGIPILSDEEPELDETFTVVFEENSENPQYRWTFTVTIKDDDPDRIPNVALDVGEHIITTNLGRLVEIPEDPRQSFLRFSNDPPAGRIYAISPITGVTGNDGLLVTDSGRRGAMFNAISNIISRRSVPIPVELSVDTGRTVVSIDYATQDGTAKAGEDYTTTSGTLTFQPGETLRYLSIPILDDAINETNEFFNVVLSNPTNSVLVPRTVKVQILDDDEPAPNPPPVNVNDGGVGGGVTPIIVPHLSRNGGSASSSLMFRPTSLSLSESGSATYQVRATSSQNRNMIVNIATTHTGITVNPNRLTFNSYNWQDYQTVTVTADADAADTNEQASIRHSIPGSEGFIANNNAGTVLVTLAHTVVEAEKETPEPPTDRQPVQQVQVPPTDYDQDDDGLIEVSNLTQLHAIRWDLNGDGQPDKEAFADAYYQAFPSAIANMGIPNNLKGQGYELTSDLDFDPNHNGHAEEADAFWNKGTGWEPIGLFSNPFQAVLAGNGHTIHNLFQDQSAASRFAGKPSGLLGALGNRGQVVGLGLEEVDIKGVNWVGGIAGLSQGVISHCSVRGQVVGVNSVGGLVGHNFGDIAHSFVQVEVSGVIGVSVFVGWNVGGSIESSSAQGRVNGATSAGDLVGFGTPAR